MRNFRNDDPAISSIRELLQGINSSSKRLLDYKNISSHYRSSRYLSDIPGISERALEELDSPESEISNLISAAENISGLLTESESELLRAVDLSISEREELEHLNEYCQALVQIAYANSSESMKHPVNFAKLRTTEKQKLIDNKFSDLNTRLDDYIKTIESRSANFGEVLILMQKEFDSTKKSILQQYEQVSEKLNEKSNELMKLSEELSNKALSGGYAVKGREELDKAESFRNGTFVMMLFIAGLLWHFAFNGESKNLGADTLVHISLIFGLLIPTTYFARESSKHRSLGNKYFETGLYLITLNPYMASMDNDAKNKIKTDLAGKLFFSFDNREQTDSMPINTQEVIMKAMDLASKAGRK